VNRLSAIDDPVALADLLDPGDLERIAQSCAELAGAGVEIRDTRGRTLVSAGPGAGAMVEQIWGFEGEAMVVCAVGVTGEDSARASEVSFNGLNLIDCIVYGF
jgi:hypothetical protein